MDSDVIRHEIEETERRIDGHLRLLEARAREAARSAIAWTLVAAGVVTLGAIAAVVVWRSGRRSPLPRESRERERAGETPMLPFGPIGMARRSTKSRSTA